MRVDGYNLGGSYEDVVYFSVKGVECSNMRWESSTTLICVSGDPLITADLGKVKGIFVHLVCTGRGTS